MAAVIQNTATGTPMSGLARALTQAGRLTPAQADALQKKSVADKVQFIDSLVTSGLIDSRALAVFCAETFGYPLMDLKAFNVELLPAKVIDDKLMQAQRVIALAKRGNKMSVAISDPTNTQALDQIKFQSEASVEPVIVPHDALLALLATLGKSAQQSLQELAGEEQEIEFAEDAPVTVAPDAANDIEDAPIVKFLNKIL
ncbi:MAG: Type pilus assembly ATPase PilB, partial [Massilia sp.]|nr:Type pilus assembly ATPase PilB [Massilia sp.]